MGAEGKYKENNKKNSYVTRKNYMPLRKANTYRRWGDP